VELQAFQVIITSLLGSQVKMTTGDGPVKVLEMALTSTKFTD
jgi:hypothetical protein